VSSAPRAGLSPRRRRRLLAKRVALAATTALIAVNIWTGAPLLALWVGSRAVGQLTLSMTAVGIVIGVLAVTVLTLAALLVRLNGAYRDLLGGEAPERRSPWLRSVSGEADEEIDERIGVTAIERIVVVSVYVAVLAFVVWFVFLARSPLPH
jgi:hypothetical protein